jgi:hypothetical protein
MDLLSFFTPIEKVISWLKRPKPEIKFEYLLSTDNENNYCHLRRNTSFGGKLSWWFRIGINNNGKHKHRIEECDVRVEKIEQVMEDGSIKVILTSPFFLHWANENTDNSRSVYPDSEVFCDVVFTVDGYNKVFIHHKGKHSGAGIPSMLDPGKYIFSIKLLGANISPVKKQIRIDFDDRWDNLMMKLL